MSQSHRRWAGAVMIAATALVSAAVPTAAHADFELVLPAGTACDFELGVLSTGGPTVTREFEDAGGDLVRVLYAGKGAALSFTNVSSGETVSLQSNGSVTRETVLADGRRSVASTGHTVLILFPTDVPAGPTTTLYVGRVTYIVDDQQVFTITGSSGRTRDICAELE